MWNDTKVLITGGTGMVARAIKKQLEASYKLNILTPCRQELDLEDHKAVKSYFTFNRPNYVFHLAGKVHGLGGNLIYRLDSLSSNVRINDSILSACEETSVKKIFFAGTVASYKFPYSQLPLKEEDIFIDEPHDGEYGYAMAKRLAYSYLKVLKDHYNKDHIYGIYTNLYGPNDRFNSISGHVIPSLIEKLSRAVDTQDNFEVWGRPDVTRDFMYVDDAARAAIHLMETSSGIFNIGQGVESSMGELVNNLVSASGYSKSVLWNSTKPIGIPRRYSNVQKLLSTGFKPLFNLDTGIKATWDWYRSELKNDKEIRK